MVVYVGITLYIFTYNNHIIYGTKFKKLKRYALTTYKDIFIPILGSEIEVACLQSLRVFVGISSCIVVTADVFCIIAIIQ